MSTEEIFGVLLTCYVQMKW